MEGSATATKEIKDPVCGMMVDPDKTDLVASYQGSSYYFCAEGCRKAFEMNPKEYLEPKPPERKGWFGRYLERLGKANKEAFGSKGPQCH